MKDIKEVANIVVKTANYHQITVDEVLQWIRDAITEVPNNYCFHYEVKEEEIKAKSIVEITQLKNGSIIKPIYEGNNIRSHRNNNF